MSRAWKPSGPICSHQLRKFGCHCSRARWSFLSSDRLTLLGIFSLLMAVTLSFSFLRPAHVEVGSHAGLAVERQRALLADGVGPLEDPVLPGGEAAEDLGLHRLRAGEA